MTQYTNETEPGKSFLLTYGADDEGNAETLARLYPGRFLYCDALGWLAYTGTHWATDGAEAQLDRAVVDTLQKRRLAAVVENQENVVKATRQNAGRIYGCKALLKSKVWAAMDSFDSDPDLLNAQNGVIDLRTGSLRAHSPADRFTYCTPAAYDPDADGTLWESLLIENLQSAAYSDQEFETLLRFVQKAVGYSLTGHTKEECMFFLNGPTRAGKGVFCETILYLLGQPLAATVQFGAFTAARGRNDQGFDLAGLWPCRFITASESDEGDWLNSTQVKNVTGGGEIRCAFKNRDPFDYRPRYKIWFASNFPVRGDPDDDALWGRLRVIRFPNSHDGAEDMTLKERLTEPEALAGLLAWAVKGAVMWYAEGLGRPAVVMTVTRNARNELDYVAQWMAQCLVQVKPEDKYDEEGRMKHVLSNQQVFGSYQTWCAENGIQARGLTNLKRAMASKGCELTTQTVRQPGTDKVVRGVLHIRFKTPEEVKEAAETAEREQMAQQGPAHSKGNGRHPEPQAERQELCL